VRDLRRRGITAAVYAVVVLAAIFGPPTLWGILLAVIGVISLVELFRMWRAGPPVIIESLLLGMGLAALFRLRTYGDPSLPFLPLLLVILATWAIDVTAYLVGSSIGTRKITPRLSPGKTWEGTLAGFAAGAVTVLLVAAVSNSFHPWVVVVAAAIGPAAFAGDLLESWVKRRAGVKDSGGILPGHGGMLDRIDSLLATGLTTLAVIVVANRMG
jgi:phosphatidate cytidylyltransferase